MPYKIIPPYLNTIQQELDKVVKVFIATHKAHDLVDKVPEFSLAEATVVVLIPLPDVLFSCKGQRSIEIIHKGQINTDVNRSFIKVNPKGQS